MGYDVKINENINELDIFLEGILADGAGVEEKMLKIAGEKAKELITSNLLKIKRSNVKRYGKPPLADDVKLSIRTDNYGKKRAVVSGGKQTGSLWHVVNDGNLHSRPTHFMDNAMKDMDKKIDEAWREAETKA